MMKLYCIGALLRRYGARILMYCCSALRFFSRYSQDGEFRTKAIEINLLPWRTNKRTWEKKRAVIIFLSITFGVMSVISSIHTYAYYLLHKQLQSNQRLRQEIAKFNLQIQEIKKISEAIDNVISRMILIQKLALTRILLIHLFDELVKVLPEDIYLTWVKKTHDRIMLTGQSEASKSVVQLIHNLEQNSWIEDPVLIEIKKNGVKTMIEENEFTISFVLPSKCLPISQYG